MPTKIEKDAISGQDTTGHEWDGVKELNTPLPKWWLYVFIACHRLGGRHVRAVPVDPLWHRLFPRAARLFSSAATVDAEVGKLVAQRKDCDGQDRGDCPFDAIKADPELMEVALTSGRITFAENCQPCHGAGGGGSPGYPALAAGAWIWGGTLADIQQTDHPRHPQR